MLLLIFAYDVGQNIKPALLAGGIIYILSCGLDDILENALL